jgi:hypothetical protein
MDSTIASRVSSISPDKLRKYLLDNGFSEFGSWGRYLQRFQLKDARESFDVLVPTTRDIDDFSKRIREAIEGLSVALKTPATELINDLLSVDHQIFRIRAHPNSGISSIPFDEGLALLESSKSLIRASAVAALTGDFRRTVRGRVPGIVDNYMDRVEIGQTDVGSYVFTLLLPPDDHVLGRPPPAAQSESVTESVTMALEGGMAAAIEMGVHNRVPSEARLEEIRLPANFFESLYNIVDWTSQVTLELDKPGSRKTEPRRFQFDRSVLSVLERTSERLSPESERARTRLRGTITRLNEPRIQRRGSLDLNVRLDGRSRTVRIPFDFANREIVISAFREKGTKALSVRGTLRTGRNGHLIMDEPEQFSLIPRGTLI